MLRIIETSSVGTHHNSDKLTVISRLLFSERANLIFVCLFVCVLVL